MNPLQQKLDINSDRYRIIVSVKEDYLDGKLSLEEGNRILKEKLGTCTPDEFAYAEQSLKGVYKDEEILDKMDDLLNLFDGVFIYPASKINYIQCLKNMDLIALHVSCGPLMMACVMPSLRRMHCFEKINTKNF